MIKPWTNTTGGRVRGTSAGGPSCTTLKRTPLAMTSATATRNVLDQSSDLHVDDLVELHRRDPPGEIDAIAVARGECLPEGDELDALDVEVVMEGRVHVDVEFLHVVLADDIGDDRADRVEDLLGLRVENLDAFRHGRSRQLHTSSSRGR